MQLQGVGPDLGHILDNSVASEAKIWLDGRIESIGQNKLAKDLYLTYSLITSRFNNQIMVSSDTPSALHQYLATHKATMQEVARVYLLVRVLQLDNDFFAPKVANIIEVADKGELVTFLRFLILLPNAENYKTTAVDALRTNISNVFGAIAYNNPYPALYFDDAQWNQMYLKTVFIGGDLTAILEIDKRANKDLARIISDYAHERWAASREIDPAFWRPVAQFLDEKLLKDMERLLKSGNLAENRAGALCCHASPLAGANALLNAHPLLKEQVENNLISWKNLKA